MGWVSDTIRNRTRNPSNLKPAPIPLGHAGQYAMQNVIKFVVHLILSLVYYYSKIKFVPSSFIKFLWKLNFYEIFLLYAPVYKVKICFNWQNSFQERRRPCSKSSHWDWSEEYSGVIRLFSYQICWLFVGFQICEETWTSFSFHWLIIN